MNISHDGITRAVKMIGQRFLGDRNVFGAGRSPGRFGKIFRLTGPQYVRFTLHYLLDVRFKRFIIADGNVLFKIVIIPDIAEVMIATKKALI